MRAAVEKVQTRDRELPESHARRKERRVTRAAGREALVALPVERVEGQLREEVLRVCEERV